MKKKHAHNRLLLLIVISGCVHASLLYSSKSEVNIPSQQGSNFAIHLKTIYPESQQTLTDKKHKTAVKKQLTKKNNATEEITANTHKTSNKPVSTSISSQNSIRSTLLTKIKTKFTKHFLYPRFAQRKGWQGKVNLAFYVSKQGNISDIHIKDSSGYAVLDQAAYQSLSQIKNIVVTDWPFNTRQAFNLPVIYKLYEG